MFSCCICGIKIQVHLSDQPTACNKPTPTTNTFIAYQTCNLRTFNCDLLNQNRLKTFYKPVITSLLIAIIYSSLSILVVLLIAHYLFSTKYLFVAFLVLTINSLAFNRLFVIVNWILNPLYQTQVSTYINVWEFTIFKTVYFINNNSSFDVY